MAKTKNESGEGEISDELAGALTGIVACGLLAAASDGEVGEEERETIVAVASALIEGAGIEATDDQLVELTDDLMHKLAEEGADVILDGLPHLLQDDDARRLGALTAAAVTAADGDVSRDEAKGYYKIAQALGFKRKEADEIWDEATEEEEED